MAEQNERPRPHGDPLEEVVDRNPEENPAQRQTDAAPDAVALPEEPVRDIIGSDANGIPAFDERDGERRKKLYQEGATQVSRLD
jgi:hypothetical protein